MPALFGTAMKSMRAELGLSQAALADRIGTTQRHVSFLETGRSQPSRTMISRLVAELNLSAAQRAALFETSGYRNPYRRRSFSSDEIARTLDMLEARLLAHWPFPAMVLDADWNILRLNAPAEAMFSPFRTTENAPLNLFYMLLSPVFRTLIVNWEDACATLYFRMQAAAAHSEAIADQFAKARTAGIFEGMSDAIMSADDIPVFVPLTLRNGDGTLLNITSMLGQLVSVHDALVEGFEVELMVPLDAETEACLLSHLPAASSAS